MSADQRIKELGIALPSGSAPAANYTNAVRTGNLLFIAGKAPLPENGQLPKGRLGQEFTAEDGYVCGRRTGDGASSTITRPCPSTWMGAIALLLILNRSGSHGSGGRDGDHP